MKVKVNQKELLGAVKNACTLIGKTKDHTIINHALISVGDVTTISSTDYDSKYTEEFDSEVYTTGKSCVDGEKLLTVVKELNGKITLELLPIGKMSISDRETTVKIDTIDSELLPYTQKSVEGKLIFSLGNLKQVHDLTIDSIGKNMSRKNLFGLNVASNNGNVRFMGADSYRVAKYEFPSDDDAKFNFIMSRESLVQSSKIFDGDITHWYDIDDTSFGIRTQKKKYTCHKIEAEFPNLDSIFRNRTDSFVVETKKLSKAVSTLIKLFGREDSADCVGKLEINGNLTISTNPRILESSSKQVIDHCGNPKYVGLCLPFVKDALKALKGSKKVTVLFTDNENPISIVGDVEGYEALLMPSTINW